jgi:hypothetical protein
MQSFILVPLLLRHFGQAYAFTWVSQNNVNKQVEIYRQLKEDICTDNKNLEL